MQDDISKLSFSDASFPKEVLDDLFKSCVNIQKAKHEYLFQSGDIVNKIYYIKEGKLKLYNIRPNGRIMLLSYHTAGTLMGNIDSYSGLPTVNFCEAVMDSELSVCPASEFLDKLYERNLLFTYISIEAKKAHHLINRTSLFGNKCDEYLVTELEKEGLTQQAIADFLGMSRMQISRIIKRLKGTNPAVKDT